MDLHSRNLLCHQTTHDLRYLLRRTQFSHLNLTKLIGKKQPRQTGDGLTVCGPISVGFSGSDITNSPHLIFLVAITHL